VSCEKDPDHTDLLDCPTGIVRADMEGRIVYANAAWKDMLGMEDGDDLDKWDLKLPMDTREELKAAWVEIVTGSSQSIELTWKWLNGRTMTG
jgi:PAS domain-containing protein